jgi:hypothetical protein
LFRKEQRVLQMVLVLLQEQVLVLVQALQQLLVLKQSVQCLDSSS